MCAPLAFQLELSSFWLKVALPGLKIETWAPGHELPKSRSFGSLRFAMVAQDDRAFFDMNIGGRKLGWPVRIAGLAQVFG